MMAKYETNCDPDGPASAPIAAGKSALASGDFNAAAESFEAGTARVKHESTVCKGRAATHYAHNTHYTHSCVECNVTQCARAFLKAPPIWWFQRLHPQSSLQ